MKTKIYQSSYNSVTIECDEFTEIYSVSNGENMGYIRDSKGKQVCYYLDSFGDTLRSNPQGLISTIRKEYKRMKVRNKKMFA